MSPRTPTQTPKGAPSIYPSNTIHNNVNRMQSSVHNTNMNIQESYEAIRKNNWSYDELCRIVVSL